MTSSLIVHHATHTGRVRDHNEDYVDRRSLPPPHQDYEVWVVADGMGGHSAGEVASRMATETFIKSLSYGRWVDPAEGLRTAFAEANALVHRQRRDMGTTLVAALVDVAGKQAWVGNVGDSRAYLLEGEQVRQVTRDHSLVQRRVDRGEISPEQAQHSKKNVLTSAIGPDARVTADVFGPFALGPGVRLLLCSDGLHGMVSQSALATLLRDSPIDQMPALMVEAANAGGGRDNITVLCGALSTDERTVVDGRTPFRRARPVWMGPIAAGLAALFASGAMAAIVMGAAGGGDDDGDKNAGSGIELARRTATPARTDRPITATASATSTPTPEAPTATLTSKTGGVVPTSTATRTPLAPTATPMPPTATTVPPTTTPEPTATPTSLPTSPRLVAKVVSEDRNLLVTWSGFDNGTDYKVSLLKYEQIGCLGAKTEAFSSEANEQPYKIENVPVGHYKVRVTLKSQLTFSDCIEVKL